MSSSRPLLGVLGGSGLYRLDGLEAVEPIELDTPFGAPSAAYRRGRTRDADIVFLPRHGDGHRFLPSEINHRANIHGFLQLDVRQVLSFTAVGSLREDIRPRDIVLPDQYVDRTKQNHTFFGDGIAAHVPFGDPVCPALQRLAAHLAAEHLPAPARVHPGGTYVNIEGPAFSTRAESQMYRTLGFDIIGMTSLPEAKLAREAGLCYAAVALVTDYDCWRPAEEVNAAMVAHNAAANIGFAQALLLAVAAGLSTRDACSCASATHGGVMTAPDHIPPTTRQRLAAVLPEGGQ
jgi:5'-methylthioadenosine phosphorylase